MGRYYRSKEHIGRSREDVLGHFDDVSCARTKPFSFDEIMSRRKRKKELETQKWGDSGDISVHFNVDKASYDHQPEKGNGLNNNFYTEKFHDRYISERDDGRGENSLSGRVSDRYISERGDIRSKDSLTRTQKSVLEKPFKRISKKGEERISTKDNSLHKGKHRETHDLGTKVVKGKMEKDLRVEARGSHGAEKYHSRRQGDEQLSKSSQSANKIPRDTLDKDTNMDRRTEKSQRDNKRKYQDRVDEKHRDDKYSKHYPEKIRSLEGIRGKERKEALKFHYDDIGSKRRRSKSQERESKKRKNSVSHSPRAYSPSYDVREHMEFSSVHFEERSGRQQSSTHGSKITYEVSSSHHRKHSGSSSGLGGYSPRKRRTDAATETPPPFEPSTEKKSGKWDIAPGGAKSISTTEVSSDLQSSNNALSLNGQKVTTVAPIPPTVAKHLSGFPSRPLASSTNVSVDSIQLTQATRPLRRVYVENVPASASEKDMMQCLNNLLISAGVNHIKGKQPCISCIINKEKSQAVIEFLTPEDASAALSFDGSSFFGSIIKIRRPKDFVEVATGPTIEVEKSVAPIEAISEIVEDSPQKIFIGGISRTLSSKMLMEIASAFGPLKAFQFEKREEAESHAFLNYADQSIDLKACAGLNGMKLGGCVITAVLAFPNGFFEDTNGNPSFCGIPEHAEPLLEKPMHVLKLKNLFDPETLSMLSDMEIEEIMDDVRIECSRFGTVKSINLVKCVASPIMPPEACESNSDRIPAGDQESMSDVIHNEVAGIRQDFESEGNKMNGRKTLKETEARPSVLTDDISVEVLADMAEANSQDGVQQEHTSNNNSGCNGDKMSENSQMADVIMGAKLGTGNGLNNEATYSHELPKQFLVAKNESDCNEDKVGHNNQIKDTESGNKLADEVCMDEVHALKEHAVDDGVGTESNVINKLHPEEDHNLEHIFEPACIFVEFGRIEASCMAAHCLHGRVFDERVVKVRYVPLDIYRSRFLK